MNHLSRRLFRAMLVLAASLLATGCSIVHPWDRDLLAQKKMSLNPTPMVRAIDQHIYFSKEGSTGGSDVDGGGCGCN